MRWRVCSLGLICLAAGQAQAHGFDERYDLPVPLAYVVVGACAIVLMSFVVAALCGRRLVTLRWGWTLPIPLGALLAARGLSLLLFALTLAAALWGTPDPLMNLAPTLVWIVWWLGLCFTSALLCNVWPALDPWRSSFEGLAALARRLRLRSTPGWRWPARLGQWPAVALLLAWCWLEVVQPLASSPRQIGLAALAWTALSWLGMAAFGRATWQAYADPFAITFATLGRMAPWHLTVEDPAPHPAPPGQTAFVVAMLSSVVFDGLHGGAAWNDFDARVRTLVPAGWIDVNGLFVGTAGLLGVWLAFLAAYLATLRLCLAAIGPSAGHAGRLSSSMALTLVPIAAAYLVAHNFSSLAIQGQNVIPLLFDPFGRQWDLFGTARWHADIGLIDARLTWFVAVGAIVVGHVAAITGSHRVVLMGGVPARQAALAMLPMTALMLAYTAVSLLLIAEPMLLPGP